jgi:glycine reductase
LKAALTCFEVAGDGGQESGLVSFVPEADAVVSTGNIDEVVELPRMERVIGGEELFDIGNYEAGAGAAAIGPFRTALRRVYCCSTMSGAGHLTARDG